MGSPREVVYHVPCHRTDTMRSGCVQGFERYRPTWMISSR